MIAVAAEPVRPPAVLQTDAERWAAVLRRDPRADGTFYYSVKTTGVYCRPSCPSRRPRFENVAFHTTREGAEGVGFRPCKRCRPDARGLAEQHAAAVARACRLIETSEEPPHLEVLAKAAGMSRFHFQARPMHPSLFQEPTVFARSGHSAAGAGRPFASRCPVYRKPGLLTPWGRETTFDLDYTR